MTIAPPLNVETVSIRYGSVTVVDQVSLSIGRGEIYGLLGPNGAGKSTLIRAISGRLPLAGGGVQIEGRAITPGTGPSRHLGRVPQKPALFDHLTVRENLFTFARLFGVSGRTVRRKVEEILEAIGLQEAAGRPADRLSGGMRQRLHMGAALLTEPSILILDEPTVGVDLASRRGLYDILLGLRDRGLAILLTTHDLPEARLLSDRIGILIAGQLTAEGTPEALIQARFGGKRHARVVCRPGTQDWETTFLETLGLTCMDAGQEWIGMVDEASVMPRLFEACRERSDLIAEMTLTRPDLADLLDDLTGTKPVPAGETATLGRLAAREGGQP